MIGSFLGSDGLGMQLWGRKKCSLKMRWGVLACSGALLGCGPADEDGPVETATGGTVSEATGGAGAAPGGGGSSSGGEGSGGSASGGSGKGELDCSGTFGSPQVLMEGTRRTSPALTGDQLELFFSEGEATNERFMVARRDSTDEAYGAAEPVPELDAPCDPEQSRSVDLSFDGLRATVSCIVDYEGLQPVYQMERSDRRAAFGEPQQVGEFYASPGLSGDELAVYGAALSGFATMRLSRQQVSSAFGEEEGVAGLEAAAFFAPGVSPDGLQIYGMENSTESFSRAVRSSADEPFGAPEPLAALSDPYYAVGAPEISQDCRTMVYVTVDQLEDQSEHWQLVELSR